MRKKRIKQGMSNSAIAGVDYILHHAALGSVSRSIENPALTNDNNVTGFLNMLIASRDANVKRFVYAASSSTYGDHPGLPRAILRNWLRLTAQTPPLIGESQKLARFNSIVSASESPNESL